jgi:hypothetical protein
MSGGAAGPAKDNAGGEVPVSQKSNGSKLTPEQSEHILKDHLSIEVVGDTLLVSVKGCDGFEEKPCPVPSNVIFFYCRRPPCPGIIVEPPALPRPNPGPER